MGVKVREYKPGAWWLLIDYKGQRKAKKIGSKKAAMEAAAKIEAIAANVLNLPSSDVPQRILFREYAAGWMEGHVRTNQGVDAASVPDPSGQTHPSHLQEQNLAEITRNEIKALCFKEGGQRAGRALSPLYRPHNVGHLQSGDRRRNHRHQSRSPARAIRQDRGQAGKFGFLAPAEGRLFLETAKEHTPKFYPIFLTALRTGMRQGEILGLQWGDIDWNGKYIEIRRASWNRIVTTPKSGKSRRVDMSDQLAQALQEHRLALT
jgi:integrase